MPLRHVSPTESPRALCAIVPPFLLSRIATLDDPRFERAAQAARRSLTDIAHEHLNHGRGQHSLPPRSMLPEEPSARGTVVRAIYDAQEGESLPGVLVRAEGEPETGDMSVTEAYEGLGHTFAIFWEVFERDSIDDRSAPLEATVHFGSLYDNAFWDGTRMVFGDGDGEIFDGFTRSLSVIGHELAHGVTEYTVGLIYQGQSGALNEHVSDVFGTLVEQYALGQNAAEASWLVGEGIFTDEVEGNALRSLKAPGTAYDDDVLGKDPQPAHLDDYIVTQDDNGGVHLNSGIPNRAFWSVADTLGGFAWERAGHIWYDTLTNKSLTPRSSFSEFAAATVASATARFGPDSPERDAVIAGWELVGITTIE
ncbi:M4 family metallopeptidase [Salinibacterium sp. M195]|uniref:M4 family metallopeptidase n=1 Tax=Salinibacterium sp. M195 TaxID=2583374 RepID=UPI001C62655C|nr:M4 family metallopeptidase [Salinibacterium sp. M195]QYH35061.1 M4 family metallopeptidase [Salinibacterium sp. M195]